MDEAIRLDPNRAEEWAAKGTVLKALGRSAEAEAAFAKAKELGIRTGPNFEAIFM